MVCDWADNWQQAYLALCYSTTRATPDQPDPLDPPAKKEPKETVVTPDLLVAPERWALLEPQEILARRVALVPLVPL